MIKKLTHITILVKNIDDALRFYTDVLGFSVHTDATMPNGFRWVTVCPREQKDMEFALMQANTHEDAARIGSQAGRMSLAVLETDDCIKTFQELSAKGVRFHGEPKVEPWGTGVAFEDLYGNIFYLSQPPAEIKL